MRLLLGLLFSSLEVNPRGGKTETGVNIMSPQGKSILKMGPIIDLGGRERERERGIHRLKTYLNFDFFQLLGQYVFFLFKPHYVEISVPCDTKSILTDTLNINS